MKKMPARQWGALSAASIIFSALIVFAACKKDHSHSRPAKGNLQNESGACMPGTVHGTYYNGVLLDPDTNYVEASIEVTQTGYYRIGSDLQNGVRFADSGNFINTGVQVVRLKPIGRFISPMVNNFTVIFDSSQQSCGFTIHVQDSGGANNLALNTWRFTAGGHVYSGTAIGNLFSLPQSPGSAFNLSGKTVSGAPDSSLTLDVGMPEKEVVTGTYNTSTSGNDFGFGTNIEAIYSAHVQTPGRVIDIVITNAKNDITSRTVAGTFSGTASNAAGATVPITDGAFKVKF